MQSKPLSQAPTTSLSLLLGVKRVLPPLAPPSRSQWTAPDEQALAHPFPPQQPEAGEHVLFQPLPLRTYLTSRSLQLLGPCPVPATTAAVTPTFEQREPRQRGRRGAALYRPSSEVLVPL